MEALWLALVLPSEDLLKKCRRETYQGSGAGGQKRNRVRSGIRLIHELTRLRAENCEHREALRNVEAATRGLRLSMVLRIAELAEEAREVKATEELLVIPLKTRPHFRVEANSNHFDYAVTAALALTSLVNHQGRLAETALELGVSGSALTRHFKGDKSIWSAVLRIRAKAGLPILK